jgi:hypothetical protein
MTPLEKNPRSGFTLIDLLMIVVILVLAVTIAGKGCALRDMQYRTQCFMNQEEADKLTWEILRENKKEIPQLSAGYILRKTDGSLKMILIFLPDPGKTYPTEIVVDLVQRHFVGEGYCPMHTKTPKKQAIIDYWYGAGRWWCLHDKYHN